MPAANPHRGEVLLAGRPLKMTTNAVCALEETLDMGIMEIAEGLEAGSLRFTTIRAIVQCLLLHGDPSITVHGAGEVIDEAGLQDTSAAVAEAFRLWAPASSGEAASGPRPLESGASTRKAS